MTVLQVDGVFNFRDVGGITAQGGRIREGMLLRSGNLADAAPSGVALISQSVSHIVDLRDHQEVTSQPSAVTGVRTTHLPLFLGSVASFFENDISLDELYRHLLDQSGARLVQAIRIIAQGQPTLVHCTVGKDRTGVTVALALAAVGAEREEIIADYALTASQLPVERNRRIVAYLQSQHPEARHAIALATQSPAGVMSALLESVDERWGSAAGYLQANGMQAAEIASLRETLVQDER